MDEGDSLTQTLSTEKTSSTLIISWENQPVVNLRDVLSVGSKFFIDGSDIIAINPNGELVILEKFAEALRSNQLKAIVVDQSGTDAYLNVFSNDRGNIVLVPTSVEILENTDKKADSNKTEDNTSSNLTTTSETTQQNSTESAPKTQNQNNSQTSSTSYTTYNPLVIDQNIFYNQETIKSILDSSKEQTGTLSEVINNEYFGTISDKNIYILSDLTSTNLNTDSSDDNVVDRISTITNTAPPRITIIIRPPLWTAGPILTSFSALPSEKMIFEYGDKISIVAHFDRMVYAETKKGTPALTIRNNLAGVEDWTRYAYYDHQLTTDQNNKTSIVFSYYVGVGEYLAESTSIVATDILSNKDSYGKLKDNVDIINLSNKTISYEPTYALPSLSDGSDQSPTQPDIIIYPPGTSQMESSGGNDYFLVEEIVEGLTIVASEDQDKDFIDFSNVSLSNGQVEGLSIDLANSQVIPIDWTQTQDSSTQAYRNDPILSETLVATIISLEGIVGSAGDDIIRLIPSDDIFSQQEIIAWKSANSGHDKIINFQTGQNGDILDLAHVLSLPAELDPADYMRASAWTEGSENGTKISVDADKDGNFDQNGDFSFVLVGVSYDSGLIDQLVSDGNLRTV